MSLSLVRKKLTLFNIVFSFIVLYGLIVTFFLVARNLSERYTIIAWFNSIAHLLLLFTLILLPLCLVMRRYLAVLSLSPALVVFAISYGEMFLPSVGSNLDETQGQRQITLMTYNLTSKKADAAQLTANIQAVNADFIAVQELGEAVAAQLEDTLTDTYPYYYMHTEPDFFGVGMGVFSRHPILSETYWRIHRAHQRVTIDFQGQPVTIYNTRPIFPFDRPGGFAMHQSEVRAVLDCAKRDSGPVILMGDFNMTDQSDSYRLVTETYTDAYREVGWGMGFTFPAAEPDLDMIPKRLRSLLTIPVVRLDYVFVNSYAQPIEAHVWADSGESDHRPLVVRVALDANSATQQILPEPFVSNSCA